MSADRPTFILVDGHSLAFRAYYAFAKGRDGGLRASSGIPTSICFGFLKSLLEAIAAEQPESLAVAFDLAEPTFRHKADPTYKADRVETPADFLAEMPNLQELLAALNLAVVTKSGYEADDVLATVAMEAVAAGYRVKILSGDRDLFQLVDREQGISVLYMSTKKGAAIAEFEPEQVEEKLGISPSQVVDYKALCGDKSDNIPGVKGIGEKTAVKLLAEYGSLDGIYNSLDKMKGAIEKKLQQGKEAAYHSQFLATIVRDVPIEISLADCKLLGFDSAKVESILEKLEFRDFLAKINKLQEQLGGAPITLPSAPAPLPAKPSQVKKKRKSKASSGALQLSLFGDPTPLDLEETTAEETAEEIATEETTAEETITEEDLAEIFPVIGSGNVSPEAAIALSLAPIKPRIIDTPEKLAELVQMLLGFTDADAPVAWDTETTSVEPRDAELVGIGCCWGKGAEDVAYIPIGHADGDNLELAKVLEALRPILESADYPKALHNVKFDRLVLRCQGIELAGIVLDTMLASYLANPEGSHKLSDVSRQYLSGIRNLQLNKMPIGWLLVREIDCMAGVMFLRNFLESQTYDSLKLAKGKTIADLDIATTARYCGMDVYPTFLLVQKLRQELEEAPELYKLLLEMEQPLEPVLAEMEYRGVRIDAAYLENLSQELANKLGAIEQQAYDAAGEQFNLGSPKQLSELLFEKLGLSLKKSRKTKTGYSTDAATLERLQGDHPVIDAIVEHRTLSKLKSTYVDALPQIARADTGRVHTNFNQNATSTGRLSSSNPNLQNIPIRTEFSRQIRKAFLPEPGWLLVSADYSQIELRILAHLSQEPVLIEAYTNNQDVHEVTAKLLFEKETVTPDERRLGKTINFGVIYGMGAQRFARSAGVSPAQGKKFIQRFNERYEKVFGYLKQMKREAIALGYVSTLFGRRRYFRFDAQSLRNLKGSSPEEIDLNSLKRLGQYDAQSLRAAANAPIQGSSADIIKVATIELDRILQQYRSRLLLQVHDELVFEIPPEEWDELQPAIRSTMENAVELSVPLVVDIHAGDNWMEAK
ncbi:MAG: DNA polymerase I [Oscillatoria sp. SIO1A7]|nr:DNA polymerase I [Oscillatoria sp. SIO1A7]